MAKDIREFIEIPIGAWVEGGVDWVQNNLAAPLDAFAAGVGFLADGLEGLLLFLPDWVLAPLIIAFAWWRVGWRFGVFATVAMVLIAAMGLWREIGPFGRLRAPHRDRVAAAISAVGLTGFEDRPIGALSGGQMQRVLFARLLLQEARLVLLDEPFTAIDARTMADLLGIVRRWHGEGRTVLAVLHDFETVREHFPETLMLARELVAHGPTAEVLTAENQFRARTMAEAPDPDAGVCDRGAA